MLGVHGVNAETPVIDAAGVEAYQQTVAPFFKTYCVSCHGPEKSGSSAESVGGN